MESFLGLTRLQKQMVAATADLIFLPLAFCLAVSLRYDGLTKDIFLQYSWFIAAAPIISIPIFIRLGLYRAVIRYITQRLAYTVCLCVTFSVLLLAALAALTTHMQGISRGVLGIYWVIAVLYVIASRFLVKAWLLHAQGLSGVTPIAIYGAGSAGVQLASIIRMMNEYTVVAFIDDKKELRDATVAGIKVFHPEDMARIVTRKNIKEIFVAIPSLNKKQQKRILERLEPLKIKTKVMPPIEQLVNGELRLEDVRNIEIEDLLGRDPVQPDLRLISSSITGKTVMVTGAGGSIGSELCRQILPLKPERLILLEISEYALYSIEQELTALRHALGSEVALMPLLGSVLEEEKCRRVLQTFHVETLYHAAAYKHVPLVECNPIEGIRNNVFGTLSIAKAAMSAGVRSFVLISTDKAVRPTNVMGSTKRLAELVLQAFAREKCKTRFCMVRFGNVLGSSGSVVPLFRSQIMAGGPVTVTHPDITRYFMTIQEAAQLVLQAGAMGEGGDVFVLDMGQPVKILDLARRMVHLSGLEVKSDETPDGTIEIQHVGLRPGEKLYEELLIGENVEGTNHPLIMRAQEIEIPWAVLQVMLNELEKACENFDYEEVRRLLLRMVSEYAPQCGIEDFLWREQNKELGNSASIHRLH